MRRVRRLTKLVGAGLLVAAIAQEMGKPEAERTWHGELFGLVPYDLRPPTWGRIRAAYWNPENPRLFTPRVLGVGWAVNLYRARVLLERGFRSAMSTAPQRAATIRTFRSRRTASKPKEE